MTSTGWPFPTSKPVEVVEAFPNHESHMVRDTELATMHGVRFSHLFEPNVKGGCTVAYKPLSDYRGSRMLECAVAYTHPKDTYCRKVGAELAAGRWLDGKTIVVPLRGKTNHETQYNIWRMFYESVFPQKGW